MTRHPRAALNEFVAALERHLEMAADRRGKDDPAVVAAYQRIANAFVDYDDALLDAYGEVTPLDVYSDDGEDDDYDEDDLDAEDHDGVDVDNLDDSDDDDSEGDEDDDDTDEEPSPAVRGRRR
ncbi:MAG: primosomal protein [Ornithinimicrobium sp.]